MPRYHKKPDGTKVEFTPEEETARDAEDLAALNVKTKKQKAKDKIETMPPDIKMILMEIKGMNENQFETYLEGLL